ncbi:MAG TPA: CHAD domain-containing protein [Chitinophagaceae bacterium]
MPPGNPIVTHWNKEIEVFDENLILLRQQLTADAIHNMRVTIKKLRSYLKLCGALMKKENDKNALATTKELFSVLGKHRNLETGKQLLLSLSHKNQQVLDPVLLYLQLLQDQAGKYCREMLSQYEKKELDQVTSQVEKELKNLTDEELAKNTRNLITDSRRQIKQGLKHFRDKFHVVRKDLKNIFYWAKIFKDHVILSKPEVKAIDKILGYLGNMQDHEVILAHLKNFRKTVVSKGNRGYDLIRRIEAKAKTRQSSFLEKANQLTDQLLRKL